MVNYTEVKGWLFGDVRFTYTERDTMFYALSIGLGWNPTDPGQLSFTLENHLQVVPTMATIIGAPGLWWRDPRTGADASKIVHGEQHLRIYRPLPVRGTLIARNRVRSLTDKGFGNGAVAVVTRDVFDESSGELVADAVNVSFLRGDGGFSGGDGGFSDPPHKSLPAPPERPSDCSVVLHSTPQSALIYRLNGDYNPIHADPTAAREAGFSAPILHGLCTYGMACHALLRTCLNYDASRLRSLAVRFTSPVYPGDAVRFELWRGDYQGFWHLRAYVDARGTIVLNNGFAETN